MIVLGWRFSNDFLLSTAVSQGLYKYLCKISVFQKSIDHCLIRATVLKVELLQSMYYSSGTFSHCDISSLLKLGIIQVQYATRIFHSNVGEFLVVLLAFIIDLSHLTYLPKHDILFVDIKPLCMLAHY